MSLAFAPIKGAANRKPLNPLQRRVPVNPKYADIKSNIDTGASAKNVKFVSEKAVVKRRDELFKRIKPSSLARLLKDTEPVESIYAICEDERESEEENLNDDNVSTVPLKGGQAGCPPPAPSAGFAKLDAPRRFAPSVSGRSVMSSSHSVISIVDSQTTTGVLDANNLLLIDLRETDDFAKTHIAGAVSHPGSLFTRDVFSRELLAVKRKLTGRILVLYHNDEKTSAVPAGILAQKGWEEVYILTGGLNEIKESYPELLEGNEDDWGARKPMSAKSVKPRSR